MTILLTGSNGFIAQHIAKVLLLETGHSIICTSKNEDKLPFALQNSSYYFVKMDIGNPEDVKKVLNESHPDIIIHAAAIGSADVCELQKEMCDVINIAATELLAELSKKMDCKLIFLSTDFIFDGKNGPYEEEDAAGPLNYYGLSKLKGEKAVLGSNEKNCVVRLCSVYGPAISGKPRGIITLTKDKLSSGCEISVVSDQWRTPTYVLDIAKAVREIIKKNAIGIYHISGDEFKTPYEMALAAALYYKLDIALIKKVTTKELKEAAERPLKTGFKIIKAKTDLDFIPINLADGLQNLRF